MEKLLSLLETNNAGERNALGGYQELIALANETEFPTEEMKAEFIADFKEVSSDEENHGHKEDKWFEILSNIQPAKD